MTNVLLKHPAKSATKLPNRPPDTTFWKANLFCCRQKPPHAEYLVAVLQTVNSSIHIMRRQQMENLQIRLRKYTSAVTRFVQLFCSTLKLYLFSCCFIFKHKFDFIEQLHISAACVKSAHYPLTVCAGDYICSIRLRQFCRLLLLLGPWSSVQ